MAGFFHAASGDESDRNLGVGHGIRILGETLPLEEPRLDRTLCQAKEIGLALSPDLVLTGKRWRRCLPWATVDG